MARSVKKPEERKKELVAVALKLFLTNGYEETSVRDIYTEIDGSFGMFYHHFESKEAIFEEAMRLYVGKLVAGMSAILQDSSIPFQKRYSRLMNLYIAFLSGRDKVSGYKRTEMDKSVFRQLSHMVLNEVTPVLQAFLEEGNRSGLLHFDDAETTTVFLLYGVFGMVRRQSDAESNHNNAAGMLDRLSNFFAKLLGADASLFALDKSVLSETKPEGETNEANTSALYRGNDLPEL